MIFAKVLKYEGDNKTFVWKHPTEDFTTGAQLIVHESQEAVFLSDGRVLDIFPAGRYTLETANLPLIRSVMNLATGGKSAFHCELYFINKTEQMAVPWGTDSKIQYLDPVYQFPVAIGACGEMSLSVANSGKLLTKVVGTETALSQEDLRKKLRVFIMKYVKSQIPVYIKDNMINVFELNLHLPQLSDNLREVVADEFIDYGIDLAKFTVMTIVTPDEDRNFIKFKELHYRQVNDIREAELQQRLDIIAQTTKAKKTVIDAEAAAQKRQLEGYTYQEERAYNVADSVAENEAVGQMSNLGVGLGVMAGVGGAVGGRVGEIASGAMEKAAQPQAGAPVARGLAPAGAAARSMVREPAADARFCINCGHPLSPQAAFCEVCGTKAANNTCANCGAELSDIARFCPVCGTKRG